MLHRRVGLLLTAVSVLTLAACSSPATTSSSTTSSSSTSSSPAGSSPRGTAGGTAAGAGTTTGTAVSPDAPQNLTPVVGRVPQPPVPFAGSDGKAHLAYELAVVNSTKGDVTLDSMTIVDAANGDTVGTMDKAAMANALEISRERSEGALKPGQAGLVYVNLTVDRVASAPTSLRHELKVTGLPGGRDVTESIAPTQVSSRVAPVLAPPLSGRGYVAADGCCESTRHRRAALPVNGEVQIAQRFAIDWEQIDDEGRIYHGDSKDPKSYNIFGDDVLSMSDGVVVKLVDGLPEQTPGTFPEGISLDEADGNSVVVDLGDGTFLNYAHLQPGSLKVKLGDRVKKGDVLGLVGNTGNSVAPHLHVHLMDTPLPVASSGLPYTIDSFTLTGQTVSTAAFDKAEADGQPLEYDRVDPPTTHTDQYPMDQSIVTMGAGSSGGGAVGPTGTAAP